MGVSFRHTAGFGKRMEYNLVGKLLTAKISEIKKKGSFMQISIGIYLMDF